MIAKLSHSHKLLKFNDHFALYIYLSSNYELNRVKFNVQTNKLIDVGYSNTNIKQESKAKFEIKQSVIIPKNSFFATYDYCGNVNLSNKNIFCIVGGGDFEKMHFYFNHAKIKYDFAIQKEHFYLDL